MNTCIREIPIPKRALSVSDAEPLADKGIRKKACDALGEICLEYVWAYPPGAPMLIPGEAIDERILSLLSLYNRAGAALFNDGGEKISDNIELLTIKKPDIT